MKFLTSFSQGYRELLLRLYLLKDASPRGQCGRKPSQCSDPKSCTLTGAAACHEAVPPDNLCTQTRHHFLQLRKALNALNSPRLFPIPSLIISSSVNMGHKIDHTDPLTTLHACLAPCTGLQLLPGKWEEEDFLLPPGPWQELVLSLNEIPFKLAWNCIACLS